MDKDRHLGKRVAEGSQGVSRGKEQVCIKQHQNSCYIQKRIKSSAGLMLCANLDVFAKDDLLIMKFVPNHGLLMSLSIHGAKWWKLN